MMSVGETLRQERLKRNVQLQEVSEKLKISSRMLEAIEADDYDKLPGGVFAKSFVRQYAAVLGLDDEEVANQFEQVMAPPELTDLAEMRRTADPLGLPNMRDRRFSMDGRLSALPSLIAVVLMIAACAGIYKWWQHSRELAAMRRRNPPVVAVQQPAPRPAAAPQPPVQAQAQPPAVTAPVTETKAPTGAAAPAADTAAPPVALQTASTTQTAAAPQTVPASAAQPVLPPGTPKPLAPDPASLSADAVHVELLVAEPVWVSVQRDGENIYQGELQPNEIRTVAASSEVTLKLGNAGGVTILLNGKPIPPAGPKGQVRTVQLTSGGFQIVPPAAPAPASPRAPALLEPR